MAAAVAAAERVTVNVSGVVPLVPTVVEASAMFSVGPVVTSVSVTALAE